jgi:peptide/nickel transport system permease protein
MMRYVVSRLAWTFPMLFAVIVINFFLLHLIPGDPLQMLVGEFPAPQAYIDQVRHDFGLDEPLPVQLYLYVTNLLQGNFGFSFANRQPVLPLLLQRAGYTSLLVIPSLVIASVLGIVLAVMAAPRAGTGVDAGITVLSLFGYSIPTFWLAQMMIVAFAVQLPWFPPQGMSSFRGAPQGWALIGDVVWHLVLPLISVTTYQIAVISRVARASVVAVASQDYVVTARAKGLSPRYILWRHILPNAMIPIVTMIGYKFAHLLTSAILVETVFAWPGLGNLFITSISTRDYPVLQGIFILTAFMVIFANLITDLLYGVFDPRVRLAVGHAHA